MKDYIKKISEKRNAQIEKYLNDGYHVGDVVNIKRAAFGSTYRSEETEFRYVLDVSKDGTKIFVENMYGYGKDKVWVDVKYCEKDPFEVGGNPFAKKDWHSIARAVSYALESIVFIATDRHNECELKDGTVVNIPNINWNPYVIDKDGNKYHYQRDFCWTLEDKQLLIESIYNYIECGKIVVKRNAYNRVMENWSDGDKTMGWVDIIDGKQRLHTILEFLNDEFEDMHGNKFSDLSQKAKLEFMGNQLFTFCELGEKATDDDVIQTFLRVNYTGKPMSIDHINYVKEISHKI